MTANQRRSGFRLPWVSESDEESGTQDAASADASAPNEPSAPIDTPPATNGSAAGSPDSAKQPAEPMTAAAPAVPATPATPDAPERPKASSPAAEPETSKPDAAPVATTPTPATDTAPEPPNEFLADLIAAMRKVADDARLSGVDKLKAEADDAVRTLEADAEKRRQELRDRADADITGVGEWASAEADRIKTEAEQRVAARRSQLEQQISAESTRTEAEAKALRARVDEYQRELDAYHAQLTEIRDPAAFAAAAKRMPAPPDLSPRAAAATAPSPRATEAPKATPAPTDQGAPSTPATPAEASDIHPAEEEVLAARLSELDEKLGASPTPEPASTEAGATTTDIVVKGLGSFGAITGFRQSLSGQPGISAVALSLGQTGEFVFRATHAPGFDVAGAISSLEGENATVEPRAEGGLRVTLERAR